MPSVSNKVAASAVLPRTAFMSSIRSPPSSKAMLPLSSTRIKVFNYVILRIAKLSARGGIFGATENNTPRAQSFVDSLQGDLDKDFPFSSMSLSHARSPKIMDMLAKNVTVLKVQHNKAGGSYLQISPHHTAPARQDQDRPADVNLLAY